MCSTCEAQFVIMTEGFSLTLQEYVDAHKSGQMRETPGLRVHDQASMLLEVCDTRNGPSIISWYLAIAMERLSALECAGIPT